MKKPFNKSIFANQLAIPSHPSSKTFHRPSDVLYITCRHLAEAATCLKVTSHIEQCSVNGIGLQLTEGIPHRIAMVSKLVDSDGRSVTSIVSEGDAVMGIDGCPVDASSMEVIEQLLSGAPQSSVRLTLRSDRNASHYDVTVKRHLPIRAWDVLHETRELVPEAYGKRLAVPGEVVGVLEEVRHLVTDNSGNIRDLLRQDLHVQTTLGFRVEHCGIGGSKSSWKVTYVIIGSAVHMNGDILEGDELLAVDGVSVVRADEIMMVDALRKNDVIGSKVRLMVYR